MNHLLLQHKADFFKSMASPVRLRLLEILAGADSSVGELAAQVGVNPSTASRHLSQLKAAGVIESNRQGPALVYRLSDERVGELLTVARSIIATRIQKTSALLTEND